MEGGAAHGLSPSQDGLSWPWPPLATLAVGLLGGRGAPRRRRGFSAGRPTLPRRPP